MMTMTFFFPFSLFSASFDGPGSALGRFGMFMPSAALWLLPRLNRQLARELERDQRNPAIVPVQTELLRPRVAGLWRFVRPERIICFVSSRLQG
jgi:hypothetical protein